MHTSGTADETLLGPDFQAVFAGARSGFSQRSADALAGFFDPRRVLDLDRIPACAYSSARWVLTDGMA